jgi:elongation factor P
MAIVATNVKRGQCIKHDGELSIVLDTDHRTPGKGNAIILAKVRSINSGNTKTIRFASSDKVDVIDTARVKLEFNYSDPSGFHFMNPATYEMVTIPEALIADDKQLLIENLEVEVMIIEGNPVSVELPSTVEIEVTEAAEGLRGDTANNPTKPATLETGLVVQVPLFVKVGDRLKIDTRTSKYLGRA